MNSKLTNKIVSIGMILFLIFGTFSFAAYEDLKKEIFKIKDLIAINKTESNEVATGQIVQTSNKIEVNSGLKDFVTIPYKRFESIFVELNSFVQIIADKKTIADVKETVVKLTNGSLHFYEIKNPLSTSDIKKKAQNMNELKDFLSERNIDLLYVQAPNKIDRYNNTLPYNLTDYQNENLDIFLNSLNKNIETIDLRVEMHNSKLDFDKSFFKTDHHWTPETGFWAWEVIAEKLNSTFGFKIDKDFLDIKNYNIKVYEDWFLGTQGKRVGTFWAGVDDISLITPKFDTNFLLESPSENIVKKGDFENVMFEKKRIDKKDYNNGSPYSGYFDGVVKLGHVSNYNNMQNKKILLVRDSYACVVAPFLSLGCSKLDAIDLRYNKDYSLMEYINETNPDLVMFLSTTTILEENAMTIFDKIVE